MANQNSNGEIAALSPSLPPSLAPANDPTAATFASSFGDYTIDIPPPTAADDTAFVDHLVRTVNEVYAAAEVGIWQDGFQRTSASQIEALLRAGELAVAYAGGNEGAVTGSGNGMATGTASTREAIGCACIKVVQGADATKEEAGSSEGSKTGTETRIGDLGMLALSTRHHCRGLGRAMVRFAEERCRVGLGLSIMRIELLFPTAAEHAFKVRLAAWYSRMGYAETANSPRSFFDAYPAYAPLLAGACDYRVYEKRLAV